MDDHKTTCVSRSLFKGIHKNSSTTNYKDHRNVSAVLSENNAVVADTKNNIIRVYRDFDSFLKLLNLLYLLQGL